MRARVVKHTPSIPISVNLGSNNHSMLRLLRTGQAVTYTCLYGSCCLRARRVEMESHQLGAKIRIVVFLSMSMYPVRNYYGRADGG